MSIYLHRFNRFYNNSMTWRKTSSDFDVTMRNFDGAETCELAGLFLLSQLTHLGVNVGLYRDDGLATCTKSPKQVDATKKKCAREMTGSVSPNVSSIKQR